MSPSEFDLRAALRDGEDDAHLDVDGVVAGARGRVAQRRMRVLSTAAAVVVVAGAGIATATVWGGGSKDKSGTQAVTGTRSAPSGASAPNAAAGTQVPAASSAAGSQALGQVCPDPYPDVVLPGGGSPGQFGSDGPMFPKPVASIIVCAYGSGLTPSDGRIAVRIYTESSATALADSIEHAAKTPPAVRCPDIVLASRNRLVLVPIATDGSRERVVTTTLSVPSCNARVTNGTAIRYSWHPPPGITAQLLALRPKPLPSPSKALNGSPPR